MFDAPAVRSWLAILHGDAPGYIHVCASGNWAGAAFATDHLDDAAEYAARLDAGRPEGVYARVTTMRAPPVAGRRGGADDTRALPALWGDIDVAGPGHVESNLPPGQDEAYAIVGAAGLPDPTLWIASGGGYYPIWSLDAPCVVGDDDRRAAALADLADLAAGWQRALGLSAARLGWRYGTGVGDLARVLRLPGSTNRKAGLERPCAIVGGGGTRYPLDVLAHALADALATLAPDDEAAGAGAAGRPGGTLPPASATSRPATHDASDPAGLSPGDDYAARTSWTELLEPHGWRLLYTRNGVGYWRRPGKGGPGISATTNALATDRFRVFTTATEFETRSYSKLAALAVLEHRGDMAAAARELIRRGYGTRPGGAELQRQALADILGPGGGLAGAAAHVPSGNVAGHAVVGPDGDRGTERAAPGQNPDTTLEAEAARLDAETRWRLAVAEEVRRIQIRREARWRVDAGEWTEPASLDTLADDLEIHDDPMTWRIDKIMPAGSNTLLAAAFKAGKTTLLSNLVRSLADGEEFLGRYKTDMPEGRVAIWNYEIAPAQYREWLRDLDIAHPDRVSVLHLRGRPMPILLPHVADWAVTWLTTRAVRVWIVDPFAAAFTGGDENSNSEVGVFLARLDEIKFRAGVGEMIIATHTGRVEVDVGAERARGATRLDDWTDTRWLLTSDAAGRRFLRATGRDVEAPEERLTFYSPERRLIIGGHDRLGQAREDLIAVVVDLVMANPGSGVNEVVDLAGRNRNAVITALQAAVAMRKLIVRSGVGGKRLHYPPGAYIPEGGDTDDRYGTEGG